MIQLDTHIVVWLYQGDINRLSAKVRELINSQQVAISPMVVLELEYLHEIGRIKCSAQDIVDELSRSIGLMVLEVDYFHVVKQALKLKWTRDTFDRLICATALLKQQPLITKDQNILENFRLANW